MDIRKFDHPASSKDVVEHAQLQMQYLQSLRRVARAQSVMVPSGSTVAIVGAGPIGLAALLTAQFCAPAEIIMIDLDDNRLEVAKRFGATATVNGSDGQALSRIMKLTGARGVDTAIEAVGILATLELCEQILAPGGTIARIGAPATTAAVHLARLWGRARHAPGPAKHTFDV